MKLNIIKADIGTECSIIRDVVLASQALALEKELNEAKALTSDLCKLHGCDESLVLHWCKFEVEARKKAETERDEQGRRAVELFDEGVRLQQANATAENKIVELEATLEEVKRCKKLADLEVLAKRLKVRDLESSLFESQEKVRTMSKVIREVIASGACVNPILDGKLRTLLARKG